MLLPIFVHVDVGQRSGRRWGLQIGLWRRTTTGPLFTHLLAIGNSRANHTTGSLKARLYGLPNGHLSKLLQDAMPKKSGNVHTMKVLIIDDGRDFTVSGAG